MSEQNYIVSKGDSIPSIAKDQGFFWKTLWNHGNNASLKQQRKNPNVLAPDDVVYIPELQKKSESRGTDSRYTFVRKGEPVKIAIKLLKNDKPRANEAYVLDIEGKEYKGNTDGDGIIKQFIPNDAKMGMLYLNDHKEVYPVRIGDLDPVDCITGIQQRLSNLGYDCDETGEEDDKTTRAITNFQSDYKLEITGEINDALKNKLLDLTQ